MTSDVASGNIKNKVTEFILHHMADGRFTAPSGIRINLPEWLSHHGLMVIISSLILLAVLIPLSRRRNIIPRGFYNLLELYVKFIRDHIVLPNIGHEHGISLVPLFCSFFAFILTMNLVGLIPSFYAATSNINVTGALAFITFAFMVAAPIARQGIKGFFMSFVPADVPKLILIILLPVELVGLLIRVFALMVRLFANILAGHLVIFSIIGLVVVFGLWALPAIVLALLVYFMETGVAFLQAYIFTLLSAIFIGQRLAAHH